MKAIQVKYLAPTNHRGSRVKAFAEGVKPITAPFNYAMSCSEERAKFVATELAVKYGWLKDTNDASKGLVGGQLPNGDYVFCFKNQ